jgi:hypothetical protein
VVNSGKADHVSIVVIFSELFIDYLHDRPRIDIEECDILREGFFTAPVDIRIGCYMLNPSEILGQHQIFSY